MKRSTRFAVSILAAAITFGSLVVFAKPMHHFRNQANPHCGYSHNHDCKRGEDAGKAGKSLQQEKTTEEADSAKPGNEY